MGSCLSSSKQSETSREEKREDPEGNEISFQEAERRKTRDNGKGINTVKKGGGSLQEPKNPYLKGQTDEKIIFDG